VRGKPASLHYVRFPTQNARPTILPIPKHISIFHPVSRIHYPSLVRFQKVTIIGVGLLGGSLGLAIKRRKLAHEVFGFVRRASSVAECKKYRAADVVTRDLWKAVSGADLIILCTPLAQMRPLLQQMLPAIKPGTIVTDVGSVKSSVVKDIESLVAKAGSHFIGSHPMAGAEKTGVSSARANLFEQAVCVVTPTKRTNRAALRKLEQFWQTIGGRVVSLTPEAHDALVSRSSHLPHVAAAALVNRVLNNGQPSQQSSLCANGFRDSTRIASGSPEMWRDIALANRKNLSKTLGEFVGDLQKFQKALNKSDAKTIAKFFETAKKRRDDWCAGCASPSPE